jgi:hypothetical protein
MPVRVPLAALVAVVGVTVGLVAVTVSLDRSGSLPRARRAPAAVSTSVGLPGAVAVLHDWDRRRSSAWAAGDEAALGAIYTTGSPARAADLILLRRYLARGLVVRGMRMQVLRVRVLVARPGTLRLEVTDRLAAAVATHSGARDGALSLPVDGASTRVLTLRRGGGTWRMARVSAAVARR